jgi:hypothetical protein
LKQVRQFAHAVVDLLKADPQLTHPAGSPYTGQLTFPYGYGVVLTNITRHQFESCGLGDVLRASSPCRRWSASAGSCFLEIRIHQQLLPIDSPAGDEKAAAPGDLLQVMDLAQEEIARNLGEGHRVIHGVAGPARR